MNATIPNSMRAVLLEGIGRAPTVGQAPVPQPGPGQVLVRMAAAPINPSDLGFLKGAYEVQKAFPVIPGFEGSGTVVAAGPGLLPRLWLGKNVACSAPSGADGSWAQYMVTAATSCIPMAGTFALEQAAMLIVNPLTAIAFFDIARQGGHSALVSNAAASALGRMVLRLGQTRGIPIINIVRRQEQAKLLVSMGARYVLDSSAPGFVDRLRTLAANLKATLVLDPVAGEQGRQLFEAAPNGSMLLIYGALSGEDIRIAPRVLTFTGKRVEGFFLGGWMEKKSVVHALAALWQVRRLASKELQSAIQERFPLQAVNQAVELYQRNPTAGKVLLTMGT